MMLTNSGVPVPKAGIKEIMRHPDFMRGSSDEAISKSESRFKDGYILVSLILLVAMSAVPPFSWHGNWVIKIILAVIAYFAITYGRKYGLAITNQIPSIRHGMGAQALVDYYGLANSNLLEIIPDVLHPTSRTQMVINRNSPHFVRDGALPPLVINHRGQVTTIHDVHVKNDGYDNISLEVGKVGEEKAINPALELTTIPLDVYLKERQVF